MNLVTRQVLAEVAADLIEDARSGAAILRTARPLSTLILLAASKVRAAEAPVIRHAGGCDGRNALVGMRDHPPADGGPSP